MIEKKNALDNGINYDEKGHCIGIEPNTYVRFLLNKIELRLDKSGRFYLYRKTGVWKRLEDLELRRMLWRFFNKLAPNCWTSAIQNQYMSVLPMACLKTDRLESPEHFVNLRNGLLDLRTFELEKHRSSVFSTVQLPINYDPDAKCSLFKKYLKTTFMNDKDIIALVQELIGFSLSNDTRHQKLFIFYGDGANGKSTLLDIFAALAGGDDNVSSIPIDKFDSKFELSQINDKKLNITNESSINSKSLETRNLKAITGGDAIQLECKFEQPFSYRPIAKLFFAVNSLPRVRDDSHGFFRRLVIIPFERRFTENPASIREGRIQRGMKEALLQELDGIFAFGIRGLERLKNNNYAFTESAKVKRLLSQYKEDIDPYIYYVRQYLQKADDNDSRINVEALYHSFKISDTKDGKFPSMSEKTLSRDKRQVLKGLARALHDERFIFHRQKSNNSRFLKGLTFKENALAALKTFPKIRNLPK